MNSSFRDTQTEVNNGCGHVDRVINKIPLNIFIAEDLEMAKKGAKKKAAKKAPAVAKKAPAKKGAKKASKKGAKKKKSS
jgi:hypothetical protein